MTMFGSLFSSVGSSFFDDYRNWDRNQESDMDQLLSRTAYPAGIRTLPRGSFPPINIGSTSDRVDVYVFAAGMDPNSIDVSIQQNLLAVSGSRKLVTTAEADYYRRERFDGDFRRVIALPEDADPDRVEAKYREGVLQITVQRRKAIKPRQVEIS
jgi:HSP20 family protein